MATFGHLGLGLLMLNHEYQIARAIRTRTHVQLSPFEQVEQHNDIPSIADILPYIRATDEYSEFCDVDMYNISADVDTDYFSILNESYLDAVESCNSLQHSNSECFSDCIHYSNPSLWPLLLLEGTDESLHTLNRMLSYYSSSAIDFTPSVQYLALGDADSCTLHNGTYTYSAAIASGLTINGHGCWYVYIYQHIA